MIGGAYFDEAGKPSLLKEGFARLRELRRSQPRDGEAYFDEAGKPTLWKGLC